MVLQKVDNPVSLDLLDKQVDFGVMLDPHFTAIQLRMEKELEQTTQIIPDWKNYDRIREAKQDINEGNIDRKLVMVIKKSKIPGYEDYHEAEFKIAETKGGKTSCIDAAMGGFIVAKNLEELTLEDEIKRTADLIGEKYLKDLPEVRFKPERYIFGFQADNLRKEDGKEVADILLKLLKRRDNKEYGTLQEYWQHIVRPSILSDELTLAEKNILLTEYTRDIARCCKDLEDQPVYRRTINALVRISDLLETAWKNPEKYKIQKQEKFHGIKNLGKNMPKDIKRLIVKGPLERFFLNSNVIFQLYTRENQGKLAKENSNDLGPHGPLSKQDPYWAQITCEVIYDRGE